MAYNLLIVDDEILEIESVRATVDFDALDIDQIDEALNIRIAREIIAQKPVDIILCDIEMPQGTGIELLEWVRNNHPEIEFIFLTCHADFAYAKQAIALGSLDYLLKPASGEEIAGVLQKAIDKIKARGASQADYQLSKLWLKHQAVVVERFWQDILSQKIPSTLDEIHQAAARIGFPGLEEMRAFPILIQIQDWAESMSARDEKLMEFSLRNVAEEIIIKEEGNGTVIDLGQGAQLALIYLDVDREPSEEDLIKDCEQFIELSRQYIKCDLCCYLGQLCYINELVSVVARQRENHISNKTYRNRAFPFNFRFFASESIEFPDMNVWMNMLYQDQCDELLADVRKFFAGLQKKKQLNPRYLQYFQQDFSQSLYYSLKQKGIQAYQLFGDDLSIQLYERAVNSLEQMLNWIEYVVKKYDQYTNDLNKSLTVVEKVKAFVAGNLDKNVTCEDIAGQVYLNPIYLTRIFKRETGLSVSEYLIREKINLAKNLLQKTSQPVSTIASQIGYNNFSHFSRIFNKYVGMSPLEYRHQNQK